jgi:L,D-transpeptidase YcbB
VTSKRIERTGQRPVRFFPTLSLAIAAASAAVVPLPLAGSSAAQAQAQAQSQSQPAFGRVPVVEGMWFRQPGRQVDVLLELLSTAGIDGINPRKYRVGNIQRAVRAARSGDPGAIRAADAMLSRALVDYARDLRRPVNNGTIYVDPQLRPAAPSPREVLEAAAAAPSLEQHVARMGWMHPLYGELRFALMSGAYRSRAERDLIMLNLERARELPSARGRHVLVNAAAQRLFMYEDGRVVDSMRVVVGKPNQPTPMMAALIRFTSLNPYWNVPPDLAAERIAPNVVKYGTKYLREKGYQLLSDWSDRPRVLNPSSVDWNAVAAGRVEVRLRQLPGPGNSMGRMKFMFPNNQGIYLHDTPDKEKLSEAARMFSGGCVRLEDAPRLASWLYGKRLQPQGARPEQKVDLPYRVPVFLTYLTAVPSGSSRLAFYDDIYGRDAQRLAGGGASAIYAGVR